MSKTFLEALTSVGKNLQSGIDKLKETKANIEDIIDIRWRGATESIDCHDIIMQIISEGKVVYIPKGVWKTSPLDITTTCQIVGELASYIDKYDTKINCSVLAPYGNQTHIINYNPQHGTAGNEVNGGQFRFSNIVISCMQSFSGLTSLLTYTMSDGYCVKIQNACYGEVDLVFQYCEGTCLEVTNSWEIDFKRLYFRTIKGVNPCLLFSSSTNGVSQCVFDKIQFESVGGTYIKCEKGCNLYHSTIGSILCECSPFEYMKRITVDSAYTDMPLFELASIYNVVIREVLINNLNNYSYTASDGNNYTRNSIIKVEDILSWVNVHFGNIAIDLGTGIDYTLVNAIMTSAYSAQQYLIIDSVSYPGTNNINNSIQNFAHFYIKKIDSIKNYGGNKSIADWLQLESNGTETRLSSEPNVLANNEKCYVVPTTSSTYETFSVVNLVPNQTVYVVVEGTDVSTVNFRFVGYTINGKWHSNSDVISQTFTSSTAVIVSFTNTKTIPLNVRCQASNRVGTVKIYSVSK